jgi:hypothetical protein
MPISGFSYLGDEEMDFDTLIAEKKNLLNSS